MCLAGVCSREPMYGTQPTRDKETARNTVEKKSRRISKHVSKVGIVAGKEQCKMSADEFQPFQRNLNEAPPAKTTPYLSNKKAAIQ
jgi:hypothetical protein